MPHTETWNEWNADEQCYVKESAIRPDDNEFECAGCGRIFSEEKNIMGFCEKCDKGE